MRNHSRYLVALCMLGLLHVGVAQARPKQGKRAQPTAAATDVGSTPADSVAVAPEPVAEVAPPATAQPAAAVEPAADAPVAQPTAAVDAKAAATAAETEKVAALRTEVTTLMDDLASTRAKAAVLGKALFKTRIVLRVQSLISDDPVLASLVLKLDGAPVFRGDGSALRDDEAHQVFESFVAPGPHVITVELEQRARDDSAFGYTLRESYRITAPREKDTELTLVLNDDSTLAEDFPDDGEGEYDVRTRLRQKTRDPKGR